MMTFSLDCTIRVCERLHEGVTGGGATSILYPCQPLTHADLAFARDYRDYHAAYNRGPWGNVGCGSMWVEIVDADGNATEIDTDGEDDIAGDFPRGELGRGALDEITGSVWDGSNHVDFVPRRSEPFCAERRTESRWGFTASWASVDECPDVVAREGCYLLADYGSAEGDRDALESAGIDYCEFVCGFWDIRELYVRESDRAAVNAACDVLAAV